MKPEAVISETGIEAPEYPKRNSMLAIGPPEYMGGKVSHFVKNKASKQFHRLGERETYLLGLMDGSQSLMDIQQAYLLHSGKRLGLDSIKRLIEQFERRGLLGESDPAHSAKSRIVYRQGPFAFKLLVFNPDPFLSRILPYVRFIFHPVFVVASIATILASETWVGLHLRELEDTVFHENVRLLMSSLAVGLILFLITATFHECAHALTCKHFGGEVPEMGILFRYLSLYPYAKLDDLVLLESRRHRVYILAAGTWVSLLFLPLFVYAWLHSAGGTLPHVVSGNMLIWYNLGVLSNLAPFLQLDGYFILAHLLHVPNLRSDSYEYFKERASSFFGKSRPSVEYPAFLKRIFVVYGVTSFCMSTYIVGSIAWHWYEWLFRRIGYFALLILVVGLVAGFFKQWLAFLRYLGYFRSHGSA